MEILHCGLLIKEIKSDVERLVLERSIRAVFTAWFFSPPQSITIRVGTTSSHTNISFESVA